MTARSAPHTLAASPLALERTTRRCVLLAYGTAWALTLLAALPVAAIPRLPGDVRELLGLQLKPHPVGFGPVEAIALRNAATCAIPLFVLALRLKGPHVRVLADVALAALLAVNVSQVGLAVGGYGLGLARWLPHLPIEWGAVAVGFGGYLAHRRRRVALAELAPLFAVLVLVCLAGAAVEIYATPHT